MKDSDTEESLKKVRVWDLPLRLFHWLLAASFIGSVISVKTDNMELHVTLAMITLGLLVFRLLWGFLGSSTALFKQFIPTPSKFIRYLKRDSQHTTSIGHSPLGALSVIGLLVFLLLQLLTGLVADDEIYTTGPLIDYVSGDWSSWATSIHVKTANIVIGLVILHIAAVLFYWIVKKDNLVLPMITGKKWVHHTIETLNIESQWPTAVGTILFAVLVAYGIFNWL